jgi:type I restriction enzyme, S subunit
MNGDLKQYPAMKDSALPWFGEIPERWQSKPLKRWIRMNAITLPETSPPEYEFLYIDIGSVGTGFLKQNPEKLCFKDAPSRARRVVRRGDTIISTVRTYLKAVYFVTDDADNVICSTGFAVLTPEVGTVPKFVSYLVQSNSFTDHVTAES